MGWKGVAFTLGVLVVWFVVNRWVLPHYGVATCCSPELPPAPTVTEPAPVPADAEAGTKEEEQKDELP